MRATPEDPAPPYTLQYALLQPPSGADSASLQAGLTPPFYATMDTNGKLQKLSVRESPDVRFNRPILAALNHWIFRPAQLDGKAVAVKVLIGIPILPFE